MTQLVTSTKLAERFGVTVGTVRKWVRQGKVPYVRLNGHTVRFDLMAVENAFKCPRKASNETS